MAIQNVEIALLQYFLWINCEINLILTLSWTCVITVSTGAWRSAITEIKLYVPFVTLSTQDNAKLLQRSFSWNEYQSEILRKEKIFRFLIHPSFLEVNKFFVLSLENGNNRIAYAYILQK